MRRGWGILGIAALLTIGGAAMVPRLEAGPAKAICLVCQLREGTNEEEVVRAVRTHAGVEYGFCSEKCAREFEADPEGFLPPVFPRPAPAFSLKDLSGKVHSTETLRGTVVLLDFWATWCVPCRKTMPELQALQEKYGSRGFTVVGVSIDEGGAAKVQRFVKGRKITYPVALDSEDAPAWDSYRVKAIPAAFLVDREGRVVAQWTGAPPEPGEIGRKIGALLAGAR